MGSSAADLRARIRTGPPLIAPGAANALTAKVIQDCGFEAVYVTGAGVANTYLGVPDIGLVTLTEMAAHVAAIRQAVDLPLVVDADTGFGNPIGTQRTVQVLERAGADAIQLEDQQFPKRCGHFEGKSVVPLADMVAKVRAACDARRGETLIVARTDAVATEGFGAAVERAGAYAEAGADMTFVEGPTTAEQLTSLPNLLPVPQVANLVEGGKTPLLPVDQLAGFGLVIMANIALQAAVHGMQQVLGKVRTSGSIDGLGSMIAGWDERQRLVGKSHFDQLEERYRS